MREVPLSRPAAGKKPVRCAIYTRKSSEEGLEQAFNSLDAQRETCESFILSQKHEGWTALPAMYDDGGISGGTLDRPALRRLLADIAAGRIDTVVVYKVDRLTRSLADFAKIVEVFERHGVTFVSVTQSFNTTTSMGRLTLNMLLSFAQFEREVAGERIRDKIAASKRKGMWMGGLPPLGYDVSDRRLVVNQAEAEAVRAIFGRYVELGSVRALKAALAADGIHSKRRVDRFGRATGGQPFDRGALYRMLQNRLYRGEIVHDGTSYPGQHEAIVDEALWNSVQARLMANRVERAAAASSAAPSLLVGLVYDEAGGRMTPTHANKKGTRYRYYVSLHLVRGEEAKGGRAGQRVPAAELEGLVEDRLLSFLRDGGQVCAAAEQAGMEAGTISILIDQAAALAEAWDGIEPGAKRLLLHRLVDRIDVRRDAVAVTMRLAAIAAAGDPALSAGGLCLDEVAEADGPVTVLSIPSRLRRAGKENRMLMEAAPSELSAAPDRSLLRVLAQAHLFQEMMMKGDGASFGELARELGVHTSYFSRIVRLSFIAPVVIQAILDGRQPKRLLAKRLTAGSFRLPTSWKEQAIRLGLASA